MIELKIDSTRDNERGGYECKTELDCDINGGMRTVAELKAALRPLERIDRVALALAVTEIITEGKEEDEDDD